MTHTAWWAAALILAYAVIQILYFVGIAVTGWFYSMRIDWITDEEVRDEDGLQADAPPVLLLYPVLHEAEGTMRTTMLTIEAARTQYPSAPVIVLAIPNDNDFDTIASIQRLQREFSFLEMLPVPSTDDPGWSSVWSNWDDNTKAYWWHEGKRRGETSLPAKKTRQMVYALYGFAAHLTGDDWLLSYLDADSAVPVDYFKIAAAGSRQYDVIQLTNVAGNLLDTWASSFHSMDHMSWDGSLYPHMSDRGHHPFYVLGKGLFFRVSDLLEFGGFHPWLTIEDPEVGMRLWTNGKRLGVSDVPLIEEVPRTFRDGVTQRKRWVAGFFQSLSAPLTSMGMSLGQRMRARLNIVPCLSLAFNTLGFPLGLWVIYKTLSSGDPLNPPLTVLSVVNVVGAVLILIRMFYVAWVRSGLALHARKDRLRFMFRVNPLFLVFYWALWMVPLAIGFWMFARDGGQTWQRTNKVDANHTLVRSDSNYVGTDSSIPATPSVIEPPAVIQLPSVVELPAAVAAQLPSVMDAPVAAQLPSVMDVPIAAELPSVMDAPIVIELPSVMDAPIVIETTTVINLGPLEEPHPTLVLAPAMVDLRDKPLDPGVEDTPLDPGLRDTTAA